MKEIIGKWNNGNITLKDESVDAYSPGDIIAIDDEVWRVYGSECELKLWCITERYEAHIDLEIEQIKHEAARVWKSQAHFDDMCDYDDTIRGFEAGTGRI